MQRIYLVFHFDGSERSVILACRDKDLATEIANSLGSDGSVETVVVIDPADE
jgi:hypothetical protein